MVTVTETPDAFYYGGSFTALGSVVAYYIARVDKATGAITPLGAGTNGNVHAIVAIGSDIYVGGFFTTAGGPTSAANNIARWNMITGTWSPLLMGANNGTSDAGVGSLMGVTCLLAQGSDLYLGGRFQSAGGVVVHGIAKWDTLTHVFSTIEGGLDAASGGVGGTAICMTASGGSIYVGGNFSTAGAVTANSVARITGGSWSVLQSGATSPGVTGSNGAVVQAIASYGGILYLGGSFHHAGATAAKSIVAWNGSAWAALGGTGAGVTVGISEGTVSSIVADATGVYVGGGFNAAGGVLMTGLGRWGGSSWSALGAGLGPDGQAGAGAMTLSGNDLYVVGSFHQAGNVPASHVAKWNTSSSTWSAPIAGDGFAGPLSQTSVNVVLDAGSVVYAGGTFVGAGGALTTKIACWDKASKTWSALGSGVGANWNNYNMVNALAIIGDDLYVGGIINTAGGLTANGIAKWNTTTHVWSTLGTGVTYVEVDALAVIGTDLYVGGTFTSAGGISADRIAKWNGTAWSALGSGVSGSSVKALAVQGNDLYVGGQFTSTGGVAGTNGIAKWNGAAWSSVGGGVAGSYVAALCVGGNTLYAAGSFSGAGSVNPVGNVAAWNINTSTWSRVGPAPFYGTNGVVRSLAVTGNDLYAGGDFVVAGVDLAARIAKWNGTDWTEVGHGTDGPVRAVATINGDLWIGGDFSHVGAGNAIVGSKPSSRLAVFATPVPLIRIVQGEGDLLPDGDSYVGFGTSSPNSPDTSRFSIRNNGSADLSIVNITFGGAHGADFTVSTPPAVLIIPGGASTFDVKFTPAGSGPRNATLLVANNDLTHNPYRIDLGGTGISDLEMWRLDNFGAVTNTGDAADTATPAHDGVSNLMKFATSGQEAKDRAAMPGQLGSQGDFIVFSYTRNPLALGAVSFSVEWTDDLSAVAWSTENVIESLRQIAGDPLLQVDTSIPKGFGDRRFVRLRITTP